MIFKKIKIIILLLIVCSSLSGCYNYNEIRDFANVAGIAIDKGEEGNKYKLTFEIITFGSSTEFKIDVFVVESEGNSIFEAVRNAIMLANKKLYLGHCKVIIISEEVATNDIGRLLDIFIRDHEFRLTLIILIAKGEKAGKMLVKTTIPSQIASYEMEKLVQNDMDFGSNAEYKLLYRIECDLLSEGMELTIPTIELFELEDRKTFKIGGIACFKKGKLISFLEPERVKYYLILINKYNGGILPVQIDPETYLSYEVKKLKTSYEYIVEDKKVLLKIKVNVSATLGETLEDPDNKTLTEEKIIKYLSQYLKEKLEQEFNQIKSELGIDIYGFEKRFREDNYHIWKDYYEDNENFFENLTIKVETKINITGTGVIEIGEENE